MIAIGRGFRAQRNRQQLGGGIDDPAWPYPMVKRGALDLDLQSVSSQHRISCATICWLWIVRTSPRERGQSFARRIAKKASVSPLRRASRCHVAPRHAVR
jgi:hypothetical protein